MDPVIQFGKKSVSLKQGKGEVVLSGTLQGRIFCILEGILLHKFDAALAAKPSPDSFNNIGGNSFWPAPEGGDFAFNYDAAGKWYVQDDINRKECEVTTDGREMTGVKHVVLRNRRGAEVAMMIRRTVKGIDCPNGVQGVESIGYESLDERIFDRPLPVEEVLLNGWSLEQLPGGDGVLSFCAVDGDPAAAINADFYVDPGDTIACYPDHFEFDISSRDRIQIGIRKDARPRLTGALDTRRGILAIRHTPIRSRGMYVNIADNAQEKGPFSTADVYSIFNGGDMGFYELETIAPLDVNCEGLGMGSRLESRSCFYHGAVPALRQVLSLNYGIELQNKMVKK